MEDDVGSVVEVMQVVAAVEASVAEDVLQHELLKTQTGGQCRATGLAGRGWSSY